MDIAVSGKKLSKLNSYHSAVRSAISGKEAVLDGIDSLGHPTDNIDIRYSVDDKLYAAVDMSGSAVR